MNSILIEVLIGIGIIVIVLGPVMYIAYLYKDNDSLIYKIRLAWMKHKCHYCIDCANCYDGKCTRSLNYKIKTNLVEGYSYKEWNARDYSRCEHVIGFKDCKYTPRGYNEVN